MTTHLERVDTAASGVYFSSADVGVEHSVSKESFLESMVYNLLFEPGGLLLPDVFFFGCRWLIENLEDGKFPIFAQALSSGLVTPAFRSREIKSFSGILAEIGSQKILGIERSQYKYDPSELARLLDRAYEVSPQEIKPWEIDMGVAFGEEVRGILDNDRVEWGDGRLGAFWSEIRSWRRDCVDVAERITRERGGTGIRRGEIWNAIGWHLGLLPRDQSFDKPRDLIKAVETGTATRNLLPHVQLYVDVVNICYQRSQANAFGVAHNVPRALMDHIEPILPVPPSSEEVGPPATVFYTNLQLPRVSTLLRLDGREVLSVRRSGVAEDYFFRRSEWSRSPGDETASRLEDAVKAYGKELGRVAKKAPFEPGGFRKARFEFRRYIKDVTLPTIATAAVGTATSGAGLPGSLGFVSSMASGSAVFLINSLIHQISLSRSVDHELIVGSTPRSELNLGT